MVITRADPAALLLLADLQGDPHLRPLRSANSLREWILPRSAKWFVTPCRSALDSSGGADGGSRRLPPA
jgi:hypothetical protein